jgi:DNA-binding MarR family transcriptional regulator
MASGRLQQELKKKQPFTLVEQEAMLNLMRTSDQLAIHFTRLFRHYGLTPSQYNILRILRGEGQPMESMEIASRTVTVVPGITGLLDRLQREGFITRKRCDQDRRVVHVSITEKALKVLEELDQPVMNLHKELMQHMTETELQELIRLLEKVRAPLQGMER